MKKMITILTVFFAITLFSCQKEDLVKYTNLYTAYSEGVIFKGQTENDFLHIMSTPDSISYEFPLSIISENNICGVKYYFSKDFVHFTRQGLSPISGISSKLDFIYLNENK